MTRTDTSNGALTRSAGVCRKRIPKRDTHSCRPRLTGLPYVPGPMLFPSPEAPARVVAPSSLRIARRSQRATLGLVGPTRVEGPPGRPTSADLRLEVRCNAIAAAILMPRAAVLGLAEVAIAPPRSENWTDSALETGARTFGVSARERHRPPRASVSRRSPAANRKAASPHEGSRTWSPAALTTQPAT